MIIVMADSRLFRVMSYNCSGFNAHKTCYIKSLLFKTDFLFLQEHWLSNDQLYVCLVISILILLMPAFQGLVILKF